MSDYEVLYDCLLKHNHLLQSLLQQQLSFRPEVHTFYSILGAQLSCLDRFLDRDPQTPEALLEILTRSLLRTGLPPEAAEARCLTVTRALGFSQQEFSDFAEGPGEGSVLSNPVYIFSSTLQTLLQLPKGIDVNLCISGWLSAFLEEVTPVHAPLKLSGR